VVDAGDVAFGHLADVDQAVLAGQDLDERAKVLDRGHAPFVNPADLDPFGHRLDLVAGRLGPLGAGGGDGDDTAVIDVNLDPGLFLEPADRLAAGADQQADLVWVDLDLDQTRRVDGDLFAGAFDRAEHR